MRKNRKCGLRIAECGLAARQRCHRQDREHSSAEDGHQQFNVPWRCGFVERNADRARSKAAQIATGFGRVLQSRFARFHFDPNRVEEILVRDGAAKGTQIIRKSTGQPVNTLGDCAQSFWTVINRIHRRDDGEENLCRTDVTRRFVAADVLLARLQGKAICGAPLQRRVKRPLIGRACDV